MNDGMPYMYNPNMMGPNNNFNPNFNISRELRELDRKVDNLERRVYRLEKKINRSKENTGMNMSSNEYYPPANDNYML